MTPVALPEGPPEEKTPPREWNPRRRNKGRTDEMTRVKERLEYLRRKFWHGHHEAKAAITRILEGAI